MSYAISKINGIYGKLHVPREIAEVLPKDMKFTAELTDEGILYRPVLSNPKVNGQLPDWVKS